MHMSKCKWAFLLLMPITALAAQPDLDPDALAILKQQSVP
jgi:hypothetical protein